MLWNPRLTRDLLTNRIRAVIAAHQESDAQLQNWGAWCRDRSGIKPKDISAQPVFRQCGGESPEGWGLPGIEESIRDLLRRDERAAKAEAPERPPYELQPALATEAIIVAPDFPQEWRRIARTAYVARLPEYQWPRVAKVGEDAFAGVYERLLGYFA